MRTQQAQLHNTASTPHWAIRTERAIHRIERPRLAVHAPEILDHKRWLVILLLGRPVVAAVGFFVLAAQGWWLLALPLAGLAYGSCITAVHHLIHSSLGLSPRLRRVLLTSLGVLVVESGHALQATHLLHHRTSADVPDPEGYIENLTWRQMPIGALMFRYRLMHWGVQEGPRTGRARFEVAMHAVAHLISLALLPVFPALWVYLTVIHVASFAFAILAGKGPQTNYGRPVDSPLVRVSTKLGRIVFFSHDKHLEHHLYPKVPLPRLGDIQHLADQALSSLPVVEVRMPA